MTVPTVDVSGGWSESPDSELVESKHKSALHHAVSIPGSESGLRITFKDLSFRVPSIKNKKEDVYLLKGVSGWFESMQMSALMGPSGSGKTTLLDLLAGRKNQGTIEGTYRFGPNKPSRQFLRKYTGYVEQFDTLLGILTVEEMLMYTAELKRPVDEPVESKREAVNKVLKKLALESCKGVTIGGQMSKGISGGQAKRTNIGIALITNPRILFLDEPTSGLDSYTANEVMTVVRHLLADGTTICATIHSPTQYCFSLFDNLLMLVQGQVVYFGEVANAATFGIASCKGLKERTEGYNDAEFLIDLVTEADHSGKGSDVASYYANSELAEANRQQLETYLAGSSKDFISAEIQAELSTQTSTVTPWWWGLMVLFRYRTLKNYASAEFLGPRIGDKVFIGLLVMTLYLGIGNNFAPDNLINIASLLVMYVIMPAFGAASYTPSLFLERALFVREKNDGLYYVITYLLSKMIEELLLAFVSSLGVTAFVFYGIRLQGSWFYFFLTYVTTLSIGIVLAYLVASFSPNLEVANAVLPTYVMTLLFFAGFLLNLDSIPVWWRWYSYIDFIKYAFGGLMVNQFEYYDPAWPGSGSTFLAFYGLNHVDKWKWLGFLSLFFAAFFVFTWGIMSFKKYQTR